MTTQRLYDGFRQRQPALASGHLGALDNEQLSPTSSLGVALTGNVGEAAADNSGPLEATVWQDNDLAFCTAAGSVLDSRNLLKRAKVMAAAAEIPGNFRVHDLRHNAAMLA